VMMELTAAETLYIDMGTHLKVVLDGVLALVTKCNMSWVNGVSVSKRKHLITGS
jgi:hypothetical protein